MATCLHLLYAEAVQPDTASGTAEIIDGKAIAATIRKEIAEEVAKLKEVTGKVCLEAPEICPAAHNAVPAH